MSPAGVPPDADPRGMILAIIILLLVILGTGILFYQSQEGQIKAGVTSDLSAIQTLKGDQIAAWREDRLYDARVLSSSAFFIEGVDHYLTYGDDESKNTILRRFREMNTSPHYDNVLLVDSNGTVRLSLDPSVTSLRPPVMDLVNVSLRSGTVALTDFYRIPGASHTSLDVISPLSMTRAGVSEPVGAVLLSINPDSFLYPLIQAWPVPSRSAETLLVEREGDHVLYLNNLRHQNDTALNLTIPLTRTDLPAVKAVLGTTGPFVGKDYRGVDVISSLGPVPGSPWFMVAKVDTAEAYASWQSVSALIIILIVLTLGGAVIIVGLLWQRRQKYYYRSLYSAEAERTREEHRNHGRLETLLHLAEMESEGEQELTDFVLDAGCRLTESPAAFIGRLSPGETVFETMAWSKQVKEGSPSPGMTRFLPCEKAGIWAEAVRKRTPVIVNGHAVSPQEASGVPPGYDPVTRFVSVPVFEEKRIVMVFTVANRETGYTAIDVDNLTLLAQGIWNHLRKRSADELLRQKSTDLEAAFEEITASDEELRANYEDLSRNQQALKKSEMSLRRFYDSELFGVIFWNTDGKITDTNDEFLRITGYTREDLEAGSIDWGAMTPAEFHDRDEESLEELRETGKNRVPFEKEYIRKDGSRVPILIAGAMLDDQRHDGVAFVLNISEIKTARAALEESERKYRNLYHFAQVGLFETSFKDAKVIACNQRYADLAGFASVEDAIGKDILGLYVNTEDRTEVGRVLRERGAVENRTLKLRNRTTRKVFWAQFSARFNYEREVAEGSIIDITEQKEAEENLRMSEERYRLILENMQDAYFRADSTGTITMANSSAAVMYGYPSPLAMIGIPSVSLYRSQDDRDGMLRQLDETGRIADYSGQGRRRDGSLFWVSLNVRVTFDEAGMVAESEGFVRDITERKRTEEALHKSEQTYRSLFEHMLNGFAYCRMIYENDIPVDFTYLAVNQAFGKLTGLHDVEGKKVSEVIPGIRESDPHLLEMYGRVASTGVPEQFEMFVASLKMWFSLSIYSPERGYFVAVFDVITGRKEAEEKIKTSETRYRRLFESAKDGILILNRDTGEIIDANPFIETLLGYAPADLIGKHLWNIGLLKDQILSKVAFEELQAKEYLRYEDLPLETRDGQKKEVEFVSNVYPVDSQNTVIQCNIRDITDRKRAEELRENLIRMLEQKNAELERFTYTVSHDLKSPLITIKGFASLLEDDALSADPLQLKKDVRRITDAAETMQELLVDVLELARVGKIISPPEKTPFGKIAHEAIDLLAGPLAEKGVSVEIPADLPDVYVDHARIREVMTNLIENAIKSFTDRPDPVIRIGVDRSGDTPVFFVKDNGIGIDPRYLERIFNLFEKLNASAHGTGVGLTIVRRIIEVHGGKIWAESEGPGKGTTFKFTLPGVPDEGADTV
jgi:PAS domain S-box-containing protein